MYPYVTAEKLAHENNAFTQLNKYRTRLNFDAYLT